MKQLEAHNHMNAEGYCKKCGASLGISGQCLVCAIEALSEKHFQLIRQTLGQMTSLMNGTSDICH